MGAGNRGGRRRQHAIAHVGDYILFRADLSQGGALVAAVPVQTLAFASYLGNSANLYGSTLALLDATGSPILTAGQAVEGSGMTSPASEAKGAEKVTATAALPGTDWTIVIREAWHSNTAPMLRFEQAVPFVLVIATAVSLLTLLFGLRLVVQPLRALAARAQRIGEGDFSAAGEPVGGVDEIEDARIALDRMAAQIRAHHARPGAAAARRQPRPGRSAPGARTPRRNGTGAGRARPPSAEGAARPPARSGAAQG